MGGSYLLDTNAVIDLLDEVSPLVEIISRAAAVYLPVITLGELYFGAEKSTRKGANLARVERVLETLPVLYLDRSTVIVYGRLKNQLRLLGKPIPENDLWIGSIAVQHQLVLATRDRHFDFLEELQTATWVAP